MEDYKISDNIIKLMAKNVFRFSEYWYQNYIIKNLDQEFHKNEYIEKYRTPIVQAITGGIQAIESKRIDTNAYLKMGANHYLLGLSYENVAEMQFLMIQAMEEFLRNQVKLENNCASEEEIQHYLEEFQKLNETVAPIVNAGYIEESQKYG